MTQALKGELVLTKGKREGNPSKGMDFENEWHMEPSGLNCIGHNSF